MCAGLLFLTGDAARRVYFPIPMVEIATVTRTGEEIDAVWGRRNRDEFPGSPVPVTGWARLESLKAGSWNRFEPERALIPARGYMEKDAERTSHWFDVEDGAMLAAVLLRVDSAPIIYMVTRPAPEEFRHIHERWVLPVRDPMAYFSQEAT